MLNEQNKTHNFMWQNHFSFCFFSRLSTCRHKTETNLFSGKWVYGFLLYFYVFVLNFWSILLDWILEMHCVTFLRKTACSSKKYSNLFVHLILIFFFKYSNFGDAHLLKGLNWKVNFYIPTWWRGDLGHAYVLS